MTTLRSRYRGCLLGGAIGDALGAGIEFMSLPEIRGQWPGGVTGYVPAYGRTGAITDDTQMTLFTAEGLLRDQRLPPGQRDAVAAIWRAYRRWLRTQFEASPVTDDGWLAGQEFLHHDRSPGTTCLGALDAEEPGSVTEPANNSKGCGGVMRVAPVGLACGSPFTLGCQAAALTHGHPSGYLAAGALALMVRELAAGHGLSDAADLTIGRLELAEGGDEEVSGALRTATGFASSGPLGADRIGVLGQGWVAEEALAIALHCALTAPNFRSGVLHAVNHGGDSDSTGAICGNLLGAVMGAEAIGQDLIDDLEGRDVITRVADDLYDVSALKQPPAESRYPAG